MAQIKLRKRKDGTEYYQVTATLGKGLANKPIHKSKVIELKELKAQTPKRQKAEAKRLAEAWEEALKDGETFDAENMTYAQLVERWEKEWLPRHLSESQQEAYSFNVRKYALPVIGHFTVKKLKRSLLKPLVIRYRTDIIRKVSPPPKETEIMQRTKTDAQPATGSF